MGPPEPRYLVLISVAEGTLPGDTTLRVKWSAGEEPEFVLDDPSTHMSLEDGSNVVCEVAADAGTPPKIAELSCELWTVGATEIEVEATGFVTHNETVTPKMLDDCDMPLQTEVEVLLVEDHDAGNGS